MQLPASLVVLTFALGSLAAGSSSVSSVGSSASVVSGTPTSSAQLPSLSGVSSCVANCLVLAASAANCTSEVAVDCFCPTPTKYAKTFVGCLTACPEEVTSAEALVERFCAAASKSTSISFPSFTPSSTSTSASLSSSSASSSVTAPVNSSISVPPLATPTGAATLHSIPGAVALSIAGVLLGAVLVR